MTEKRSDPDPFPPFPRRPFARRRRAPRASCRRVRERLPELLDGGLAPLDEARDQGHLEACAGCVREQRHWHRAFGRVRRALAHGRDVELAAVRREVSAGIRELSESKREPVPASASGAHAPSTSAALVRRGTWLRNAAAVLVGGLALVALDRFGASDVLEDLASGARGFAPSLPAFQWPARLSELGIEGAGE